MALRVHVVLAVALIASPLNSQSNKTPSAKNGTFVGSKACYGCHSAIYRSFEETDMGRSMTLAARMETRHVAPASEPDSDWNGAHFRGISHSEQAGIQKESEPRVFATEYPLEYAGRFRRKRAHFYDSAR